MCLELLLNGAFSNGSFKKPLLNGFTIFLGLTFAFLLQLIIFTPTDCPSHSLLIPIQCSKNKNLKTNIVRITNLFSSVFYIKREMRETERERRKKEERKETEEIKIEI
jgi:hypothetical protein